MFITVMRLVNAEIGPDKIAVPYCIHIEHIGAYGHGTMIVQGLEIAITETSEEIAALMLEITNGLLGRE